MNDGEKIGKHVMKSFKHATYYTCAFDMVCLGTCECKHMPLLFRPDTYSEPRQTSEV